MRNPHKSFVTEAVHWKGEIEKGRFDMKESLTWKKRTLNLRNDVKATFKNIFRTCIVRMIDCIED